MQGKRNSSTITGHEINTNLNDERNGGPRFFSTLNLTEAVVGQKIDNTTKLLNKRSNKEANDGKRVSRSSNGSRKRIWKLGYDHKEDIRIYLRGTW